MNLQNSKGSVQFQIQIVKTECDFTFQTTLFDQFRFLPTSSIILRHHHRHLMPQPPDHLELPVTLVSDHTHRPQIDKWHRDVVPLFLVAGKDQNGITPLIMTNQILPVSVMLRRNCLRRPVQKLSADRVIRIHGTGRKFLFRLLECHQQHIRFQLGEMHHAHAGLPGGLQIHPAKGGLNSLTAVMGMQFQWEGKGELRKNRGKIYFFPIFSLGLISSAHSYNQSGVTHPANDPQTSQPAQEIRGITILSNE